MSQTNTIRLVTTKRRSYWTDYAEPEEVLEYFKDHTHIGFDTETSGFSFMNSTLHSIQFGDLERQYVIDLDGIDIHVFAPLFKKTLVLQNATFDLPFLYKQGYVPHVYDTLLAEKNLSLGLLLPRGLGDLVRRYCDVDLDKSMQSEIAQGLVSYEAIAYAGLDVKYLLEIMHAQVEQARREKVVSAIELDCRFARVVAYMEFCGFYVDLDALQKLVRRNEAYEYMAEEALYKWLEKNHPELYDPSFNWGSSQQVIALLNNFGIQAINKKTGQVTADIKELRKLPKHELIDLYIDYATRRKIVTTYGRNWFEYLWPDGRVHSKFNVLVDTGRTSSGDTRNGPFPNLQNQPRDGSLRKIFKGKGPNVIITCDYSGQESVVLADMSEEPKMLDFYRSGSGDLHSFVAKLLFKKELQDVEEADVSKTRPDLRQLAKGCNFAIAYGGTGYTISENLNVDRVLADSVYEAYMKAFPDLAKFFELNYQETARRGYVRINKVTGRKRKIDGVAQAVASQDRKVLGHINRLSTNTKIQGTSADISKTAAVLFFDWIIEQKLFGKVLIVNFVHDEIVAECHQRRADVVSDALRSCMEKAGTYFLKHLSLTADPKISKEWSK